MKTVLCGLIIATTSLTVAAQDVHVVDVQPRYVIVYQQQCQQVLVQRPASGANGAAGALGAIFGAAVGNQIGGGSGRDIATAAGAVIGYQIGKGEPVPGGTEYQTVCNQVPTTVQRGETVTFSYRGVRFIKVFD
jgi:uncharacterized protein YcfJ